MKDHILCPYYEKFNNTANCVCPDGYFQQDNVICVQNSTNISEMIYSSNYTFTIIVTALLIVVFIRTVTSMGEKQNNTLNISNSDVFESNDTKTDTFNQTNQTQYRTCCFCWKYKKPSYQYKKRRRFIHLEQSLYVLGKTQAQAHA